jgi:hypothetical protein
MGRHKKQAQGSAHVCPAAQALAEGEQAQQVPRGGGIVANMPIHAIDRFVLLCFSRELSGRQAPRQHNALKRQWYVCFLASLQHSNMCKHEPPHDSRMFRNNLTT